MFACITIASQNHARNKCTKLSLKMYNCDHLNVHITQLNRHEKIAKKNYRTVRVRLEDSLFTGLLTIIKRIVD